MNTKNKELKKDKKENLLLNWSSLNNIRTFHILWFLIAHVAYMVDSAMCEVPIPFSK
jgi:hypothetical protein